MVTPVLRKELPGVAFIRMALYVEAADAYAIDELGVDVVCAKSDDLEDFLCHIDRLLAFRSKASPEEQPPVIRPTSIANRKQTKTVSWRTCHL